MSLAIPKNPPMRDRALLDLCHRVQQCQVQIPEVCRRFSLHGCEPAHGPKSWTGGGGAMKSADIPAAACHECHAELDQGKRLSEEDRQFYWARGAVRTMALFFREGWVKVARGRDA